MSDISSPSQFTADSNLFILNSTSFAIFKSAIWAKETHEVLLEFYKTNKGNLKIAVFRAISKPFVAEDMEEYQLGCSRVLP